MKLKKGVRSVLYVIQYAKPIMFRVLGNIPTMCTGSIFRHPVATSFKCISIQYKASNIHLCANTLASFPASCIVNFQVPTIICHLMDY